MKNLDSYKCVLAGWLFLILSIQSYSQDRPNFIIFLADDVGWSDIGCYGNDVVNTPNIDGLARKGLQFNSAFLTASSCSPSRCSIISGKYPHSSGAAELHTPLPESEIPFPLLLKDDGYYTAQAGKWHMGPSVHQAFDRYTDDNGYDNGDGGEDNWVRFLEERPKDKPFFMWFASHDAHRPWGADEFEITHNPDSVDVPLFFSDTEETRRDIASYYNEISRFDYFIGKVVEELEEQDVLANTVLIIMSDNGSPFPRNKTRVYDSGMKTPFVVYWPTGLKNYEGSHVEGLVSAVDIAPTILDLAGIESPMGYQGISFMAMLKNPTLEIRDAVYSEHNWHDYEAHERMVRTKEYLYVLNSRPQFDNGGPADSKTSPTQNSLNILRDEGKLTAAQADVFVSPRPYEELFDIKNGDILQLTNVASDPRYYVQLQKMRELLKNWQNNTGDSTPDNLTPDWYDRETGGPLKIERTRGEMPGQ